MNTSQFINWLLDRTGSTITRTEMLFNVNLAQNELASYNTHFFRTKPDPYLVTTGGTYEYTLGSGVRSIARVYITDNYFGGPAYNGYSNGKGYKQPYHGNSNDYEIDVPVDCIDAISPDSATCKVIFPSENDPGTTSTTYRLEQYKWPTQLTSESISLSIPEYHQTRALYYIILRMLEEQEYHNSIYNEEKEKQALKDWLTYANSGNRSVPTRIIPRSV